MKAVMRGTTALLLACVAGVGVLDAAAADESSSRAGILALMRRVNQWQVKHPVMPAGNRNWERATWYTGVMSAWKETRDPAFFDQAMAWGHEHKWQVGTEYAGANRLFCVETWLELYFEKRDAAMIAPVMEWYRTPARNSPATAARWYLNEDDLSYIDSLYGASALAMLSEATQDPKYLKTMQAFFDDLTGELFDKEAGPYFEETPFIARRTAQGRKIYWSRGNGWVISGITRVLEYLPANYPRRQEYVELLRRMSAALARRQDSGGLWFPNLDDPKDVPQLETSGAAFFCHGIAWGINHGVLDRATYLPVVKKAWAALVRNVSPEGKVSGGQPVDFQPNAFREDSTHEYVTGAFLLAGSQMYRLAGTE
jgi:unsaturated rhamnogalacturonyl hydrolase